MEARLDEDQHNRELERARVRVLERGLERALELVLELVLELERARKREEHP